MSETNPTLTSCQEYIDSSGIDKNLQNWRTSLPSQPSLPFEADKNYCWDIVTNKGPLKIKLWPDIAPMHVSSTIYLTELGFYDGTLFHRVIQGFMAQGGCPDGTGRGEPGYTIPDEFHAELTHDSEGVLSMANAGPNTGGSQFFVTLAATDWLDGKHAVFGKVVEGIETVRSIGTTATGPGDHPLEPVVMESVRITGTE